MSSLIIYCPHCGLAYETLREKESFCPHCATLASSQVERGRSEIAKAFFVWGVSVALLFVLQLCAILLYSGMLWLLTGERPAIGLNTPFAIVTLTGTLIAHILTLGVSWWFVTSGGKRPFGDTLGWRWHHQFKWIHAVALAFGMLLAAYLFEKMLPHGKTDFERLLQLSLAVRIAIVILAVFSAPLVEEIVYRGILYSAFERARSWKIGVVVVTLLFAIVHVPQYWGSPAAIAAILSLSLVLTILRALTGQLLPCVVTHLTFNGVQAVVLLASPPKQLEVEAVAMGCKLGCWLGISC